jgi:tyrosine phenol-lyase
MLDLTSFETAHQPRPHVNSLVRPHHPFSEDERRAAAIEAGWNVFQFPSEMLRGGDLLSDSGTTTLTTEQFAALVMGDESYGSNWGYFKLLDVMTNTLGIEADEWEILLFHQGRAAEHALYSHIKGDKLVAPSNSFFDTTRANAEAASIEAIDLVDKSDTRFRGNLDLAALEELMSERHADMPLVVSTITNNTGGGQPVSMANIRATRALCDRYDVPFFLDACRFAENAWFIKTREDGYADKSIAEIVAEEFSYCDGFTLSLKKDGLANMGGVLALRKGCSFVDRRPGILDNLRDYQILVEGHPTYGGLTGRDIMTITVGLETVIREDYLRGRIEQVQEFGRYLTSLDIPLVEPFGGHAIYIDTDRFFEGTRMQRGDFGGISMAALLLLKGVRLCELGAYAFGVYDPKTDTETYPAQNYVRAAVPRNKYEIQDLYYVADCIKGLHDRRDALPRAVPTFGRDKTLRHFKSRFELVSD